MTERETGTPFPLGVSQSLLSPTPPLLSVSVVVSDPPDPRALPHWGFMKWFSGMVAVAPPPGGPGGLIRSCPAGKGGGHLEPPSWCPALGSQGREAPGEPSTADTLDTPDSGLLRVPADHHPWPWGTSSTRAGHQSTEDKVRGPPHAWKCSHVSTQTTHQHPHQGTGWPDVHTSRWPADTLDAPTDVGTRAPAAQM